MKVPENISPIIDKKDKESKESTEFDVDGVLKTEGLDAFLIKVGIDADSFDPYSNESDREVLEKHFKTFNEQKEVQKGVVEFLRNQFKQEAGIILTDEQLKSVREQVEEKAVSDPEGMSAYLKQLQTFQKLPQEIAKTEAEITKIFGNIGSEELDEKNKELLHKKRTLELAASTGFLQSFIARRSENLADASSIDKLKPKFLSEALDKTADHFKVNDIITDEDREFIKNGLDVDNWEGVNGQIEAHFKAPRTFAPLSEEFIALLINNVEEARARILKIDVERSKEARLENEKLNARKEAQEKYGVEVPILGSFPRLLRTKKGKNLNEEMRGVQKEVSELTGKMEKSAELKDLSARMKEIYSNTRKELLNGFLDTKLMVEEARKMVQKKLQELVTEGGQGLQKGQTAGTENVLKYLGQLEMVEATGGIDYLENGVEIEGTKYSLETIRDITQKAIEKEISKKISAEIDKIVSKGKPDSIALALRSLFLKTTVGEKFAGGVEAMEFVNETIAFKVAEFSKNGEKVKILNLRLALKKLQKQFSTKLSSKGN